MLKRYLSLILSLLFLINVAPFSVSADTDNWKEKLDSGLLEIYENSFSEYADSDGKISVSIWYNDINQIERKKKTKARLGYDISDIESSIDNIALKEILTCKDVEDIKNTIKQTANARKNEQRKTDKYILESRKIAKSMYNVKLNNIKETLHLDNSLIQFESDFAPMLITKLSKNELKQIAKSNDIDIIYYYNEFTTIECSRDNYLSADVSHQLVSERVKQNIGWTKAFETFGLTGENVKVGIYDSGVIDCERVTYYDDVTIVNSIPSNVNYDEFYSDHAANSANVFKDEYYGLAVNAKIYSAAHGEYYIEQMIAQGISILSVSLGFSLYDAEDSDTTYAWIDKYFDHIVSQHRISVVVSAGNDLDSNNNYVDYGALGYNVITVGAYSDNETSDHYDDFLFYYSCYDTKTSRIKPDLVTNASFLGGGTSTAAPVVAASIALILELKPTLATYPETIKSILLASCQRKVITDENIINNSSVKENSRIPASLLAELENADNENLGAFTRRQGAGALDIYNSICIVANHQYYSGILDDYASYDLCIPSYGSEHVSIISSWSINNSYTNNDCQNFGVNISFFDQVMIEGDYQRVEIKDSYNNYYHGEYYSSSEMWYTNTQYQNNLYSLELKNNSYKLGNTAESVYYGIAWCFDEQEYHPVDNEFKGLFKIKRKSIYEGDYYIYHNDANNIGFTMDDMLGMWYLDFEKDTNTERYLGNINTTNLLYSGSLSMSSEQDSETDYVATISQNNDSLIIKNLEDGAYSIIYNDGNTDYYLSAKSTSVSPNFSSLNNLSYNSFIFERYYYLCGDLDMNGVIDSDDKTLLTNYLINATTFNNSQLYLADINKDDVIDMRDSLILTQYINGTDVVIPY